MAVYDSLSKLAAGVLLLGFIASHVDICMGRDLVKRELSLRRGLLQGECEVKGEALAAIAMGMACHKIKLMCIVGENGSGEAHFKGGDPLSGLEPGCKREAKSICRTRARGLVTESGDRDCWTLLNVGPSEPEKGCWNWQEAVDEFNWIVKSVCEGGLRTVTTQSPGDDR